MAYGSALAPSPRTTSLASQPTAAKALYDYSAQQPDELSIRAGEELTLMGKEEAGWYQCRNVGGNLGMVPSNYLTIIPKSRPTSQVSLTTPKGKTVRAEFDHTTSDPTELPFKTGDVIEVTNTMPGDPEDFDMSRPEMQWWEGRLNGRIGLFPVAFVSGWQSFVGGAKDVSPPVSAGSSERYKALYAYQGKVEGELSFGIGDVIRVTNKSTGSAAWWEGVREADQRKGQFPVSYVEKLHGGSEWVRSSRRS
jgi:hypothetical protein